MANWYNITIVIFQCDNYVVILILVILTVAAAWILTFFENLVYWNTITIGPAKCNYEKVL